MSNKPDYWYSYYSFLMLHVEDSARLAESRLQIFVSTQFPLNSPIYLEYINFTVPFAIFTLVRKVLSGTLRILWLVFDP
jgi:hypothetical protein